ncbi:MAG: autotransporter-associated beta strand repeat-containing protein [Thermoguttaceae bacterium]|nr:autotransporter-associated beta strand repeat-containing protein [Thermoguttaceae bacterium]
MANTQMRSFIYSLFAIIAILCVSNVAQADLVTYWTFNEGTFSDSSGNGYTGSSGGTAPTIQNDGIAGKTFYGNANGKYNINISTANVNLNNFSVSFWGKQTGANWKDYISLYSASNGDNDFQRANNTLTIYNTPWGTFNGSANVSSGFHHFVFTSDSENGVAKLYIDNVLQTSINKSDINEIIQYITIGGNFNSGGRNGTATVDEIQFYNQPLTTDQISYIYNNPKLYSATAYQRNVTANGNWSDADWNANGQTGQAFANSSAVQLDATNSPTLTVDQNVTVNSIDFNGSMTVDGSNTITLNGEKRITVANAADTATISAPITAQYDNSITKTGAGTLKLSGTNTHTGGTTVTGGTLAVTSVNALGSGDVTLNGGTLNTTGVASGSTFANGIAVGENGGTVTAANGTDLSGAYTKFGSLSGSGALTTNGWVQFNGTGGYNGHLTVNSGYTQINPNSVGVIDLTINSGAHFSLLNAGTLQIGKLNSTADVEFVGSQSGNAYTIEIGVGTTSTDTAAFAGYIHGPTGNTKKITIKKVGAGTQTFNRNGYGFASPDGTIKEVIVEGGTMILNGNHTAYSASSTTGFWGSAPITVKSGATLIYEHIWNTSMNTMLTVNGGTLTLNAAQYQNKLTLNSATVNGNSNGELRVGYQGAGAWTVTGGTSTIYNNVITVKSGSYTTFTINIADGATLDIKKNIVGLADAATYKGTNLIVNGAGTPGSQGAGTIKFNPAKNVIMKDMGTFSFNNVLVEIAGDASWLANGYFNTSAVTLTNSTMTTSTEHTTNNTNFTLNKSVLKFDGIEKSYIKQITLKNGSSIQGTTASSALRTGHQWNSQFITAYDSGNENVMNTIYTDIGMYDDNNSNCTITFNIADKAPLTVKGSIHKTSDSVKCNSIVKTGAGVLTLESVNIIDKPVTISEGKLVLSENGTLGTSAVTNNATLEFDYTTDKDFANAISGTGTVIKSGSGTLTLTQAPGYTGATTVESGTLALSVGGTLYNLSGAGDVNYGANALTLSNSAATTFSGDILGSGAFTKTGTGTLTLSQAPEYTGATSVQQGTLALADGGTLYNLSGGSLDANGNVTTFITLPEDKDLLLSNSVTSKFIGSITAKTITKDGDGTMQIYTGANGQVDAQSLVVSSGRMDFKGYMTHSITVDANAVFSPGNSIGEATYGGGYILNEGATLLMEIGGPNVENNDSLYNTTDDGTLTIDGLIYLVLSDNSSLKGGDEFVAVLSGSNSGEAGFADSLLSHVRSYYFTNLEYVQLNDADKYGEYNGKYAIRGILDANAVPEPSTWALLILGAAGLLFWRKRK